MPAVRPGQRTQVLLLAEVSREVKTEDPAEVLFTGRRLRPI